MELLEAIRNRHSVREFAEGQVSRETIEDLIECAMMAPTGGNMQCWKYIAVTDPAIIAKLRRFSPGLMGVPQVVIALLADYEIARTRLGEADLLEYTAPDVSLAAENLMLRAVDLGLGTCAVKSYNTDAVRKILRLPDHIHLEYLITLGIPKREGSSPKRKLVDEVLFYDTYPQE